MKHLRSLIIIILSLTLLALPVAAGGGANLTVGQTVVFVGTVYVDAQGDIIFTANDGTPYEIIPAGGYIQPNIGSVDPTTLFMLQGTVIENGSNGWPPTISIGTNGRLAEYFTRPDTDNDGIADADDNCPSVGNTTQADGDNDGLGDACDRFFAFNDSDNDGVPNMSDICPAVYNPVEYATFRQSYPVDNNGDGIGDACVTVVQETTPEPDDSVVDNEQTPADKIDGDVPRRGCNVNGRAWTALIRNTDLVFNDVFYMHCYRDMSYGEIVEWYSTQRSGNS